MLSSFAIEYYKGWFAIKKDENQLVTLNEYVCIYLSQSKGVISQHTRTRWPAKKAINDETSYILQNEKKTGTLCR